MSQVISHRIIYLTNNGVRYRFTEIVERFEEPRIIDHIDLTHENSTSNNRPHLQTSMWNSNRPNNVPIRRRNRNQNMIRPNRNNNDEPCARCTTPRIGRSTPYYDDSNNRTEHTHTPCFEHRLTPDSYYLNYNPNSPSETIE